MAVNDMSTQRSAFAEQGLRSALNHLMSRVQAMYLADQIPWVVGYSGGKDSTATLQLVWLALEALEQEKLTKPVHVITTDTLVENPIVAAWVDRSLAQLEIRASEKKLPIYPHKLVPEIKNTFWVNLIGKGYPAPRPKFRWCTERMKIKPADQFISTMVRQNGEAIVVLGTRRAESSVRAARMKGFERQRTREGLSPHTSMPNAYIFSPIEDWTNDDVWLFLMQYKNPWGHNNKDLLTMYQGATADGECPLVIDTSTPSCGDSRFGCWVCTMVEKDKSMTAMIQNDEEKEWMEPLLRLRNELDEHDHDKRDFRRMSGHVHLYNDRPVPGPYTQDARAEWLRKLLKAQQTVRSNPGVPAAMREIELISLAELQEIRRIWVVEKYEIEDLLPEIYEQALGESFPGKSLDDAQPFGNREMQILKELCDDDDLHFALTRELLEKERTYRTHAKRAGLYSEIEKSFRRHFYDGIGDAAERARSRRAFDEMLTGLKQSPIDFVEQVERIDEAIRQEDSNSPVVEG